MTKYIKTSRKRGAKSQRGMALVIAMITMFMILTIVLLGIAGNGNGANSNGTFAAANNGMQASYARMHSVSAFNLAESGIEYTLEWFHKQPTPPSQTAAFAPSLWSGTVQGDRELVTVYDANDINTGSFSVKVYPSSNNTNNTQKKYVIESEGTAGGYTEIIRAYVQQVSFSNYSYFSNEEYSNGYWIQGLNSFDGPMHTNSVNAANPSSPTPVPTNMVWYDTGNPTPLFTYDGPPNAFSAVASTVAWQRDSIGNFSNPSTTAQWLSISTGGSSSIVTGTDPIPLPTSSNTQQVAALGSATAPSTTGVIVPNSGSATTAGVYIHGAVNNMILTAPASTMQEIEIDQTQSTGKPIKTYITENLATNQTTVVVDTTNTNNAVAVTTNTYSGVTNGVVYADSTIGSNGPPGQGLSGVVANNYTNSSGNIVTPNAMTIATASNQNIYMNGSLTYLTQRQKDSNGNPLPESQDSNYVLNAGTVGMVSNTIVVDDTTASNTTLTNMQIDATMIAYNTIDPNNSSYGGLRGTFTVNGGYIANQEGIFGTVNGSGVLQSGFGEHYHYDPRLANTPPPYFPTTSAVYSILSWQRVSSVLE